MDLVWAPMRVVCVEREINASGFFNSLPFTIIGFAGAELKSLHRITGLDPAGNLSKTILMNF